MTPEQWSQLTPQQQAWYQQQWEQASVQQRPNPPPHKPRRNWTAIALGIVAAVAVLFGVLAVIGSGVDRSTGGGSSANGLPASSGVDERITIPNVVGMTGDHVAQVLNAAGATNVHLPQHAASLPIPLTQPVTEQTPRAGTRQMPGDRVLLTLQELPPEPARSITSREWAVIAKSPDTHQGQRLIVFGHVTQFDSVTGPTGVPGERGRSAARRVVRLRHEHDPAGVTNTILQGSASQLTDIVADDTFRAEVSVLGSYTYETTMGGSMTVPMLQVDSISRT
jgi:hypothetical protein